MSRLKKYASIAIIMLCIMGINTTDVSGCCECCCCCFCCWPKVKCALCLKEKRFRMQRSFDLVICDECNAIYPYTAEELDAPYLVKKVVSHVVEEKEELSTPKKERTPLLGQKEQYEHLVSPKVTAYTDTYKTPRIYRWLTDQGLLRLIDNFITQNKELTRATLLKFIQDECATIDDPRKRERFAQTYMAGLHMIAHRDTLTTHASRMPSREAGIKQYASAWHGELVDVLDRVFKIRAQLLTCRDRTVHDSIWQAWTQGAVPESSDIDTIMTIITHDNAMGYPGFVDRDEAEAFAALIPRHIVKRIVRRSSSAPICYVVCPPSRYDD